MTVCHPADVRRLGRTVEVACRVPTWLPVDSYPPSRRTSPRADGFATPHSLARPSPRLPLPRVCRSINGPSYRLKDRTSLTSHAASPCHHPDAEDRHVKSYPNRHVRTYADRCACRTAACCASSSTPTYFPSARTTWCGGTLRSPSRRPPSRGLRAEAPRPVARILRSTPTTRPSGPTPSTPPPSSVATVSRPPPYERPGPAGSMAQCRGRRTRNPGTLEASPSRPDPASQWPVASRPGSTLMKARWTAGRPMLPSPVSACNL